MSREIKFRARRDALIIGYERIGVNGWEWMCPDLNPDNGERWTPGIMTTSMGAFQRDEFTGLKDKNGKDIYEDDVLKSISYHQEAFFKVIWIPGMARFNILRYWKDNRGVTSTDECSRSTCDYREVIGNIHQNPELL